MFSAPPCLANIKCVRPLYIIPSLLLSFRALRSCSPIHLKYVFFSENASIPNISCRSWITIFGMHLGRPQIFFCIAIIFLSNFFDGMYRIWYCIEAICNSYSYFCINHINFLFDSCWTVC